MLMRRWGHNPVHYVVYLRGGDLFLRPAGRTDIDSITTMDVTGSSTFEWIRTGDDLRLTYRAKDTDREKSATLRFGYADQLDEVVKCFGILRPPQRPTGSVV